MSRKDKFIQWGSFVIKGTSVFSGLAASPLMGLIPEKYMFIAVGVFALASWAKDGAYLVCDFLDDWKLNKSYKVIGLIALAFVLPACYTSCATNAAGQKTVLSLNADSWKNVFTQVGNAMAKAAMQSAVPAYLGERVALTSAKGVRDVTPK